MPLYEYRCQSCGKLLEVLQKISEPPRTECPSCGQNALVKQLTAAGFQLKGTGWYATDSRGGGASTVAAKTDSSPSDTKPASEGAAAKPATEGAKVSTVEPSANPTPSAAASS